jgi:hypothetical protein
MLLWTMYPPSDHIASGVELRQTGAVHVCPTTGAVAVADGAVGRSVLGDGVGVDDAVLVVDGVGAGAVVVELGDDGAGAGVEDMVADEDGSVVAVAFWQVTLTTVALMTA